MLDQLEECTLGPRRDADMLYRLRAQGRARADREGADPPDGSQSSGGRRSQAGGKQRSAVAVAKRGRTGGPTSAGARTPTTRPSQSQRQLFTAPGAQAETATPSAATADHLPILLSLTPEQWEPFQTI